MARPSHYPAGLDVSNRGVWSSRLGLYQANRSALVRRDLVIPLNFADGTGTNTTKLTLPASSIVIPNPKIYVRTAEATGTTKTLEVGVTGTAAGFINGLSAASTGMVAPTLTNAAVTLGSLLFVYGGATSTAPVREEHIVSTAVAVTWTPGSTDWANFDADLILPVYIFADLTQLPLNLNINNIDYGAGS